MEQVACMEMLTRRCDDQATYYIEEFRSLGDESGKTLYKVLYRPGGVTRTGGLDPCFKVKARYESKFMPSVYFINH